MREQKGRDRTGTAAGTPRGSSFSARGLAAAVFVLLVAGVCVRLGFWQLDRLEQRRERNQAMRAALAQPPLELSRGMLEAVRRDPERFLYRRVRIRGEYLHRSDIVQRARLLQGRPGVYLYTPLQIAGSAQAVLVHRGWTPAPDAATVDPRPLREPDARMVEGILQPFPHGVDDAGVREIEVQGAPVVTLQRLDSVAIRQQSPLPLLPLYVQLLPGSAAPVGVERVPLPELSEGPHLGYAVQWFSFAAIALGGFAIVFLRSRRTAR